MKHEGVVVGETSEVYKIKIVSVTACASCHARNACTASDMKDKMVDVDKKKCGKLKLGDAIMVVISKKTAKFAVLVAYVIPIILLVIAMVLSIVLNISQLVSAVCMLALVALYFMLLYIFRDKLKENVQIFIE